MWDIVVLFPFDLSIFFIKSASQNNFGARLVVTGTQVVENDAIALNGNLIVENGGFLTIRGVTLTMNNSYNGEYGIRVKSIERGQVNNL